MSRVYVSVFYQPKLVSTPTRSVPLSSFSFPPKVTTRPILPILLNSTHSLSLCHHPDYLVYRTTRLLNNLRFMVTLTRPFNFPSPTSLSKKFVSKDSTKFLIYQIHLTLLQSPYLPLSPLRISNLLTPPLWFPCHLRTLFLVLNLFD